MMRIFITLLLVGLTLNVNAQLGQPDPSVRYAELLGYSWSMNYAKGSVDVTLPNDSIVDSWAFYRGEVGLKYSYCEKKGYGLVSKIKKSGRNHVRVSYCSNKENGKLIQMDKLLYENGDYSFLFPQGAPPPGDSIPPPSEDSTSLPPDPELEPGEPLSFD